MGETYTLSAYVKDVSGEVLVYLSMTDPPYGGDIVFSPIANDISYRTITSLSQVSSGTWKVTFGLPPGSSISFADIKLEEGPVQTLGYKDSAGKVHLLETPDYGAELARCQQYQLALRQYFISPAVHFSTDYIDFSIPTPVEMRTAPTIDADGISIISDEKGNQAGFVLSVVAKSSNAIRVRATKAGHGLSVTDGVRLEVSGDIAMINANL